MTVSTMTVILLLGATVCALQSIRVKRLLQSALWLAGASAITSLLLYQLGAPQAAVIELSVGAGLVIILFVFAINLTPGEAPDGAPLVPVPLAATLVSLVLLLLGELAWPRAAAPAAAMSAALSTILWQDRQLDVVVQIVLIFAGALTVAGLLAAEIQSSQAAAGNMQFEQSPAQPAPVAPAQPRPMRPTAIPLPSAAMAREPQMGSAERAGQKENVA